MRVPRWTPRALHMPPAAGSVRPPGRAGGLGGSKGPIRMWLPGCTCFCRSPVCPRLPSCFDPHNSPPTSAQSSDREIAEDLLRYFVEEGQRECFAACLYTCYDLIKPDVALEVAWTNGLMDAIMPFLIQTLK